MEPTGELDQEPVVPVASASGLDIPSNQDIRDEGNDNTKAAESSTVGE